MKNSFWITFIIIGLQVSATAQTTDIKDNHGSITINKGTVTRNYYNTKEKDNILNVSKYIDTAKNINFSFGSNFISFDRTTLKSGTYLPIKQFLNLGEGLSTLLKLKLEKGKLKISVNVFNFEDKLLAKIVDNRLVTFTSLQLYASDKFFELIDENNIPVLQLYLDKATNTIKFQGAFNFSDCYLIISDKDLFAHNLFENKLLMSREARDKAFYEFKQHASSLKIINENE